jgi:membrane protein YdbS with pleckstrin-like domain
VLRRWAALPKGPRWAVGVFAAVIVALGIAWVVFVPAAGWLAHLDVGSAKGSQLQTARDDAQGRLLTLGAGLFAAGALIFTARNYTLSREGQVTDRYTKAIEQLGSDSLDVRTGGIYSLERVARDSARDHPTVMEVLAAFVREQSHEWWPLMDDQSTADVSLRVTRPDVQAAVAVIGRRDPKNDRKAVDLNSADLTGADLTDAVLAGAQLNGVNLAGAQLNGANLTGAQLNGANLTGARLTRANLADARLTRANLTSADLTSARLADAWLPGVDFTRADLDSADLTRANLAEVTLTDANLRFADMTSANLTSANLTSANFVWVYLTKTVWPPDAAVPEGWQRDPGSGRLARDSSATVEGAGLSGWLREFLFPGERIALVVRQHPIVIVSRVALLAAGLAIALALTTGQLGVAYSSKLIWPLYAALFLWAAWRIVNWRSTYFVVTENRLILVTGVFKKYVGMMSLAKVTDIRLERTPLGRALNYGTLVIESAGQEGVLRDVAFVPYPDEVFRVIIALLYPKTAG